MKSLSEYRQVCKTYHSKKDGYNDLGVNMAIHSHRAKVWKTRPDWALLYCHLHPACSWQSALVRVGELWELRKAEGPTAEHDPDCTVFRPVNGKIGFETLEQRKALTEQFTQNAVSCRPRAALRAFNLAQGQDEDPTLKLKSVQRLKKTITGDNTSGKLDLGDLVQTTAVHTRVPAAQHQGYFAVREVSRSGGSRPEILLIATTKKLMARWSESTVACIDGGFKYNIMGYPLHHWGVVNPSGQLAVTGLGVTSSMSKPMIKNMLSKYADQVKQVTGKMPGKAQAMSDAEESYRYAMKEAFACENVMCWFHVCQAVRDWLGKHARVDSSEKATLWTQVVKPDLDEMHFSLSQAEFKAKAAAVLQRWSDIGLEAATTWQDKAGTTHSLNSYFESQWLGNVPEWHRGHKELLPSTNNAAESNIRLSREDAGSVPNAMKEFVGFLIAQAEHYSKLAWDPARAPAPSKLVWRKASVFRTLFRTPKVLEQREGHVIYHVCKQRSAPGTDNVADRPEVKVAEANRALSIRHKLQAGEQVTYEDITFFSTMRIFWYQSGSDYCVLVKELYGAKN